MTSAHLRHLPPPAYFAAAFTVGTQVIDRVMPSPRGRGRLRRTAGGALLAASAALGGASLLRMRQQHTSPLPFTRPAALVTDGPYAHTRNPMYVAMTGAYVGASLARGSLGSLVTLPPALVALQRRVIEPEESLLGAHFGRTYDDYRRRTPRWLSTESVRWATAR